MQLSIHGKQMDVGDALRSHVSTKISDLNQKYFNHAAYSTITFSREGHGHPLTRAHIMIQLGKNIMVVADATEQDPYVAFDSAAAKAGKQLQRYKNRLRNHHERMELSAKMASLPARDYVLSPHNDEHPEEAANANAPEPVVIAEMTTEIQTMSVSDAVMRMDLSHADYLLFKNPSHNGLNVVYRRPDGNIGWIDPENMVGSVAPQKRAKS